MATVSELAADVVRHVSVHGLDNAYYSRLDLLRGQFSHPNAIIRPLQAAGLPEALRSRAERLELGHGDLEEVRRLRDVAGRFQCSNGSGHQH